PREPPQLALRSRCAARRQGSARVGELGAQHGEIERPLRPVVVVAGGHVDRRARRDVAHGGAVEAALGEQLARGGEEPVLGAAYKQALKTFVSMTQAGVQILPAASPD